MFIKKLLGNRGMSFITILTISTSVLAGIGLVTTQLLPRYFKESVKARDNINYNLFITSFMDYTVHALRERWCLDETWLQSSKYCIKGRPLKETVTYKLNLERLFWTDLTFEDILKLDHASGGNLEPADLEIPGGEIKQAIDLKKISTNHPLYAMVEGVLGCMDGVDVVIKRDSSASEVKGKGDEIKININITGKINTLLPKCLNIASIKSSANYSFFPRRLFTFSLIKAGDYDTTLPIDFYGPVYAENDIILPPTDSDKSKMTIFNANVVLGGGVIRSRNGDKYSFEDCGSPRASYQDQYEGFEGFLGGLTLDYVKDPGIEKVFNPNSDLSTEDSNFLSQCLAYQDFFSNLSHTDNSKLMYKDYNQTASFATLKLGLSNTLDEELPDMFTELNMNVSVVGATQKLKATVSGDSKPIIKFYLTPFVYKREGGSSDYYESEDSAVTFQLGNNSEGKIDFSVFAIDEKLILDEVLKLIPNEPAKIDLSKTAEATITLTEVNQQDYIDSFIKELDAYKNYETAYKALDSFCTGSMKFSECNPVSMSKEDDDCVTACTNKCVIDNDCESLSTQGEIDTCKNNCSTTCTSSDDCTKAKVYSTDLMTKQDLFKMKINDRINLLDLVATATVPDFVIQVSPSMVGNKEKTNVKDILVRHNNFDKLKDLMIINKLKLEVEIIDIGFNTQTGANIRNSNYGPNRATNPNILFVDTDKDFIFYSNDKKPLPSSNDWMPFGELLLFSDALEKVWSDSFLGDFEKCNSDSGNLLVADWDISFLPTARYSWKYAPSFPGVIDLTDVSECSETRYSTENVDGKIEPVGAGIADTLLYGALCNYCVVEPERDIIFGLHICDNLIIESGRKNDLTIVGTFLVNNIIFQNPNEGKRIKWYNFWVPEASEIYKTYYLSEEEKTACMQNSTFIRDPIALKDLSKCSLTLKNYGNGPNNFEWTTVDPERGRLEGSLDPENQYKVRDRFKRFIVVEVSRKDEVYVY